MSDDAIFPAAVTVLLGRLALEEGTRRFAYNDATGKTVSCKPQGNLSIGRGINLETGFDDAEMDFLEQHRVMLAYNQIIKCWWWQEDQPVRGSVILDVAYNDGVESLLHFPKMLAAYGAKDWHTSAAELLDSDAARELPPRYARLSLVLSTGLP